MKELVMPDGLTCFVFGASGHGKVVVDALRSSGRSVSTLVDDDPAKIGKQFIGLDVISFDELLATGAEAGVVAIGDNGLRKRVALRLQEVSISFRSVVHAYSYVAESVVIGDGTVIFAGAVLNCDARVGCHVIVNTSSSVDHDCCIGDFVHVGPGARLCGGVSIGSDAFVGAGCVVLPGVSVGLGAVIGAGAIVTRDVPACGRVAGNPARQLAGKMS